MNKTLALLSCFIFVLALAGCEPRTQLEGETRDAVFPEFLVGRWDATIGAYRQIIFAADGSISALGISVGIPGAKPARLIPNETTVVEVKDGRQQTVKLGDCVADYSPETRELIVFIDVEHLRMVYGSDLIVEGDRKDVLVGTVSEDGKTWEAGWIEYYDYGGMFPMDPNREGIPVPVIFEKVAN